MDDMQKLYGLLESFQQRDDETIAALDNLGRVATREPNFKLRWNWIKAVTPYLTEAVKLSHSRQPIPEALLAEPMKAAKALMAADPLGGAPLIVKGWTRINHGDTPSFFRFAHSSRDMKAQPLPLDNYL